MCLWYVGCFLIANGLFSFLLGRTLEAVSKSVGNNGLNAHSYKKLLRSRVLRAKATSNVSSSFIFFQLTFFLRLCVPCERCIFGDFAVEMVVQLYA